jgi:hypothetical protein
MVAIDPNEVCPCGSGKLFKDCHALKIKVDVVPPITKRIKLKVIPEPAHESRGVIYYRGEGTIAFKGFEVGLAMDCGKCQAPLVVGVPQNAIRHLVIRCKQCGSFNDTA